jgi:hypothetical protein
MLTKMNGAKWSRRLGAFALLCGLAVPVSSLSQVAAIPGASQTEPQAGAVENAPDGEVRDAIATFLRAMMSGDEDTVWMFASEEEQAAFATESATYAAYAEDFPVLTRVETFAVENMVQHGDTPFATVEVKDDDGMLYQATIGLWRDDAGDWKVISCEVTPGADHVV